MVCKSCKEDKPEAEYYKESRNRSGLNSTCKVCVRARNKTYTYTTKPHQRASVKAIKKRWEERNPHNARERSTRYRTKAESKAKRLDRNRTVNKANVQAYANRRRALKAQAEGSHTTEEWLALVELYGGICLYPGCTCTEVTRDHVIPLSAGGSDYITNIQPLCKSHNSSKLAKHHDYRPNK